MKQVTSPWFVLAIQNNPAAVEITDPAAVPGEFMRQPEPPPLAPDKTAIKAAWASGQPVPGTRLAMRNPGNRGSIIVFRYAPYGLLATPHLHQPDYGALRRRGSRGAPDGIP